MPTDLKCARKYKVHPFAAAKIIVNIESLMLYNWFIMRKNPNYGVSAHV